MTEQPATVNHSPPERVSCHRSIKSSSFGPSFPITSIHMIWPSNRSDCPKVSRRDRRQVQKHQIGRTCRTTGTGHLSRHKLTSLDERGWVPDDRRQIGVSQRFLEDIRRPCWALVKRVKPEERKEFVFCPHYDAHNPLVTKSSSTYSHENKRQFQAQSLFFRELSPIISNNSFTKSQTSEIFLRLNRLRKV